MLPYPNLQYFNIGPLEIRTWGVFVAAGFLIAFYLAVKKAEKRKLKSEIINGLVFYAMLGAIVGGRLGYAIGHLSYFLKNPLDIFKIWNGGMVMYGGVILGIILCYYYIKKKKVNFWKYTDLLIPYIGLGIFIGRIGCFFNGCCFGEVTSLPWGVIFPTAPDMLPRHPTELYHSLAGLIIFLTTIKMKKIFLGSKTIIGIIIYSSLRFIIEFFRYYPEKFRFLTFSASQWISLLVFIISGLYLYHKSRKNL